MRTGTHTEDTLDAWRSPRFGKSDQLYADRGYSFVRVLPTVCLTAGVVTLSLTIGTGEKFAVQVKPARMGGLLGFRGTFE